MLVDVAPPPVETRTSWLPAVLAGWLAVGGAAGLLASYVAGVSRFWPVIVAQSALPVLVMPACGVAALAIVARRRWLATAAALVSVLSLVVLSPYLRSTTTPAWVASAPRVRVLSANIYFDNGRPDDAVAAMIAADADVIVLAEVTSRWVSALEHGGLFERYPYRLVRSTAYGGRGQALLSRLPIEDDGYERLGGRSAPTAVVRVGGRAVRIVGFHAQSPSNPQDIRAWKRDLDAARRYRPDATGASPAVILGDFNATYWHAPYRALLTGGWHDAHQLTGAGLSASWPNLGVLGAVLGPFTRLDHAVVSAGAWPVAVHDVDLPGSDHRAFVVDVAVNGA